METINVPLSGPLKNSVQSEAAARGFSNAGDYIQSVLSAEQKRKARAKVEAMIDVGVASGEPAEWTKQDLERLKEEIRTRHAKRHGTHNESQGGHETSSVPRHGRAC
jgi:Arc/MetJ-type ribon-helix-helix transcriptional regulator